ncbi:MAG: FkbM family methyltransferase [Bdellovibrionales bacterium]|nr:FkbM family methyltransferase [Bdellovibrionales bacterium]
MLELLKLYSHLPNFKGKNFLGQRVFARTLSGQMFLDQEMQDGFKLSLDVQDRMQRMIYIKRCHEPETEKVLKKLISKAKVFCDIGANFGYFSFLAQQLEPQAQIYSFEPLPKNIENFKKNLKLNAFSKIELVEACLSDQIGETEFLLPPAGESGWGRMAHRDLFSGEKIKRSVITLDSFFLQRKINQCDLIKIDVEGYEFKVLQGARNVIAKFKPQICIELNEPCLIDTGTSGEEIFKHLKSLGYRMHSISSSGELNAVDHPLKSYEYMNYIALMN